MQNYLNTKTPRNGGTSTLKEVNEVWKKTKPEFALSNDPSDSWSQSFTKRMWNEQKNGN